MRIGLILLALCFCVGCRKYNSNSNHRIKLPDARLVISNGETTDTSIIDKNCSQADYHGDHVEVCLDSVIEDSRCPNGVVCVWSGTAIVRFLFTVNQDQRTITLSTVQLPMFPSDTTLMGYKIKFINLLPYPDINSNHNVDEYEAQLIITKQ